MINRALTTIAILVAACGSPAASFAPVTLHAGDPGLVTFPAGRYVVTWTGEGCQAVSIEVAPTSGSAIAVPSSGATVSVPAGPAYVNRSGSCPGDLVVTLAAVP